MAYKSIKYELCNLKAKCTNLAKEFTTAVFLDVNRRINLSLVERYMKPGWNLTMIVYSSSLRSLYTGQTHTKWTSSSIQLVVRPIFPRARAKNLVWGRDYAGVGFGSGTETRAHWEASECVPIPTPD